MTAATPLEKSIVLKIFKDFTQSYNPSSIARLVGRSRVGTYKALKILEKDSIVRGKALGKARFYAINLADEYARKNVETLLLEEAKAFARWKDELQKLFELTDIVMLFGSVTKNEEKAHDVDVLLVFSKGNNNKINQLIKEKNHVLIKKLHPLKQTMDDMRKNMQRRDAVLINAIKEGIVLHGHEKIVRLMQNVTNQE